MRTWMGSPDDFTAARISPAEGVMPPVSRAVQSSMRFAPAVFAALQDWRFVAQISKVIFYFSKIERKIIARTIRTKMFLKKELPRGLCFLRKKSKTQMSALMPKIAKSKAIISLSSEVEIAKNGMIVKTRINCRPMK